MMLKQSIKNYFAVTGWRKWRRYVVVPFVAYLAVNYCIDRAFMAYSVTYIANADESTAQDWLTKRMLRARIDLGERTEPPSDEEMIRYFHANEKFFNQLVERYYDNTEIFSKAYDRNETDSLESSRLRLEMAKRGIVLVSRGGYTQKEPVRKEHAFRANGYKNWSQYSGLELRLFERGGSFAKHDDPSKSYLFMPQVESQSATPPIRLPLKGWYVLNKTVEELKPLDCGMKIINDHWAVTQCPGWSK